MESDTQASVVASSLVRPSQAQGLSTTIKDMGYYDIMIIGRTGMGKTTTTEKLLVANPDGIDYSLRYSSYTDPETYGEEGNKHIKHQDICMWRIPAGGKDVIAKCAERMKLLTLFRANTADCLPHQSINESRATISERTVRPELFSNEITKIRVLDVRGFFGTTPANNGENPNQKDRSLHSFTVTAMNANSAHLGTMRSILHIQASMAMKFRRILYFLPCRDTLESSSIPLREELQLMYFFFGQSIFKTMIVVATLGPVFYKAVPKDTEVTFPQDELDKCKATILGELKELMPTDTPQPPIIFISQNETCESILEKVKNTQVANDGLHLQLKSTVCARCSATIGEKKGERVATTDEKDWSKSMIYEDSHCHPFMVPKYSRLQKIVGGIAYVVKTVVKREPWKWPDFNTEQCIECGCAPGSLGCWHVFTDYTIDGETFVVNHSNKVQECQELIQEDLDEPVDPGTPPEQNPDDIPSSSYLHSDGTFRNVQSDALVFGVRQRAPKTTRIRSSASFSTISLDQSIPIPRPRTKLQSSTISLEKTLAKEPVTETQNSTATLEIMPADDPAIKSTDTSLLYRDEGWENGITPSEDLDQEYIYQKEVRADVHSFTPPQHDRRSWPEPNSFSNDSSKKGT